MCLSDSPIEKYCYSREECVIRSYLSLPNFLVRLYYSYLFLKVQRVFAVVRYALYLIHIFAEPALPIPSSSLASYRLMDNIQATNDVKSLRHELDLALKHIAQLKSENQRLRRKSSGNTFNNTATNAGGKSTSTQQQQSFPVKPLESLIESDGSIECQSSSTTSSHKDEHNADNYQIPDNSLVLRVKDLQKQLDTLQREKIDLEIALGTRGARTNGQPHCSSNGPTTMLGQSPLRSPQMASITFSPPPLLSLVKSIHLRLV